MSEDAQSVLELTKLMLECIVKGDWKEYLSFCDPSITCFEPEAVGHLVEGLAFHRYYFDRERGAETKAVNITIASPHVRMVGNVAIVAYIRLIQTNIESGEPVTKAFEETRVWEKRDEKWKHIHFHRSRA